MYLALFLLPTSLSFFKTSNLYIYDIYLSFIYLYQSIYLPGLSTKASSLTACGRVRSALTWQPTKATSRPTSKHVTKAFGRTR